MTSLKTILFILLATFLLVGCQSSSTPETGAAPSAAPANAQPASATPTAQGTGDAHAMAAALYKATSWHAHSDHGTYSVEMDVSCPDKMRIVSTKAGSTENIQTGGIMYTKTATGWTKAPAPKFFSVLCGPEGLYSQPTPLGGPIAAMTRGEMATVNGEGCRQWTLKLQPGVTPNEVVTCLGDDNLPRQSKVGPTTVTFTGWNKPVTIEAPQ